MGIDCQFDGLPGPTHNYSGMSHGNVASERHAGRASNPREAALQGLAKMRAIASRGHPQAVLPPHERPHVPTLRALGFSGSDADVLARAAREAPSLLSASSSAAAMWTANAAIVSASADTADGRVHFTPANLASLLHRSIEAATTTRVLRAIFADPRHFDVHDPLPVAAQTGDEGAANHTRFAGPGERDPGVELFVHGRSAYGLDTPAPRRYPARQTREACEAIARRHGLDPVRTVHAQQHPDAIDAGVFHNDVIAVGQGRTLLAHERAWTDTRRTVDIEGLPGFATKVIKPTNTMEQIDRWDAPDTDGSHNGTFTIEVKGAPVKVAGNMSLEPTADGGTRHTVNGKLDVKVPLIGGKIAAWAEGPSQQRLDAEYDFHRARLGA